jgi:restriction endonuclease Mrr
LKRKKPVDLENLPSGTDIRWKNKVAWERQNLVSRGLLKKGSLSGILEISEEGKRYLKESKS